MYGTTSQEGKNAYNGGAETHPAFDNKKSVTTHHAWTVASLYDAVFPEPKWIVPDVIPEGLTILGGRPKVGKSWFLLQLAYAVGVGGQVFGKKVEKGEVLYLALEDSPRRLQSRIKMMEVPRDADVSFRTIWKPLHMGGLADLLVEIEANKYRLVIIDTLSRALSGLDQSDPTKVAPILEQLQSMASGRGFGLVMSDHIRKPMGIANDPIDDIMSATAKTATADTILALYKEQGKQGATLMGRGRDVVEMNMRLSFDFRTGCWNSEGDAWELSLTGKREEVLAALKDLGKVQLPKLNTALGGKDRGNLYKQLSDMVNAGLVAKETISGNVYYSLPMEPNVARANGTRQLPMLPTNKFGDVVISSDDPEVPDAHFR